MSSLTAAQEAWLNQKTGINNYTNPSRPVILAYLETNFYPIDGCEFVEQFIQNSLESGLNLDFQSSLESPMNVDISTVSGNSPEEIRFRNIYSKLKQSPKFRDMFINMFQTTTFINSKFVITDIPQGATGYIKGDCMLSYTTFGTLNNRIRIDKQHLQTASDIDIAFTILHECMHAFLNVKLRHPNIGIQIDNINDMDLAECINTVYNGFNNNQDQHNFFVNNMIPTLVEVLSEIKNEVLTPQQISSVENPLPNSYIYGTTNTNPSVLNYSVVVPWNWNSYFTYLSFSGLHMCSQYNNVYPIGSSNSLNMQQYTVIGIINFTP